LFAAATLLCGTGEDAAAGPRTSDPPPAKDAPKKPRPMVGQGAAVLDGGPSLSARSLLDELRRLQIKRDELKRAAEQLDRDKATLAAAQRALDEERAGLELLRTDLALQRDELAQWLGAPPSSAKAPAAGTPAPGAPPTAAAAPTSPDVTKLVLLVRAMKADKAARVLDQVELPVVAQVLAALKPTVAAAILERMKPERGAALAVLLTRQPAGGT
jgi:flagellar motility protein MotE (MotC chaperone)